MPPRSAPAPPHNARDRCLVRTGGSASAPAGLRDRTSWHLAANAPVAAWLVALLAVALLRPYLAEARWLLVHLLLLGAVTNAIFVWSAHFADAMLRRRATTGSRRWQAARIITLNAGILAAVAGMTGALWLLTLAGSVLVGAAAAAHGITLARQARAALPSRFGPTVHYYVVASLALPIGAGLGASLALDPAEPWHGRLVVAHITLNLLGWIGLTVLGTLVTLWPTMLRTRIAGGAERVARQALPVLAGSVVVAVAGSLRGLQWLAAGGVAAYLGGVLWAVRPLAQVARSKRPSAYATWSVMAAVLWLIGTLAALVAVLALSPTWLLVTRHLGLLVVPLAAGFAAQVLLGALTFLVPVVLGGGPTILRGTQARMDRGGALRAVLINAGLLAWIALRSLRAPGRDDGIPLAVLVLGAFAAFLPLLVSAVRYAVSARRAVAAGEAVAAGRQGPVSRTARPQHVPEPVAVTTRRHTRQAVLALALVFLAVALGTVLVP